MEKKKRKMLYNRVKGSLSYSVRYFPPRKEKTRKQKVKNFKKKENQNSKGMNIQMLPRFSQYKDFNLTKKVQFTTTSKSI